jgi:formylglycine-generating enzyme required for sulfatase activity
MSERDIFTAAREMLEPAVRSAYLDRACAGDLPLRDRVEALLRAHEQPDSLLDHPAGPELGPTGDFPTSGSGLDAQETPSATVVVAKSDDEVPLGFLEPATRPDSLGRIGHYEVLQVLGQGGFGIVFRAFDEVLHRVVAVKVLSPQMASTSPARKRFLREARSSAQVRHENVVQVYEVGEQPLPFIVMEFIPGETLQQRLDRVGPVDAAEVVRIGRQIAEGLAAAHAMDLIHRDIKPGNVLLEGGAQRVKITDFGLARAADDASLSQSGIIAGTPMYMAPEQVKGETLDQRADLFSLGSVLYQMTAGRSPFRATGTLAVLKRVAEDKARPIREIIPETPQWLCDIISKLHAKKPEDRYPSAREVADILADCEAQLKANGKLKDFARIPQSKSAGGRSGRWKWVAVAAVLLAGIAVGGAVNWPKGGDSVGPVFNPPIDPVADNDGWVQLFNGKDLTGWKKHPNKPGFWRVDDKGILVGEGPVDYAFLATERDDFENFHLRVEARVDTPESDSGVFFRLASDLAPDVVFDEVNICFDPAKRKEQTGSLLVNQQAPKKDRWLSAATGLAAAKEWFTLEIIARGEHVVTKVNGKLALETRTPSGNRRGHFLLQQCGAQTIVRFRKIEIKELAPTPVSFKPGDPEYTNTLGMKFKLIPAGKFTMGSPQEEIDRCLKQFGQDPWVKDNVPTEGPEHPVEITRPFYLGVTAVTVGQFRQFVDAEGYQVGDGRWRNPGFDQTDQHPVVFVSWNNATEFCNWLSAKEGKEYRLPTEAEWEYCCRAGKAGSRYGFGDDEAQLENYAWYLQNSGGGTHPVGKKKPNDWGLYEMHGNVWQWCQDNYDPDYYKTSPVKDPPGPGAGGERVCRGGAWDSPPLCCRSAFRQHGDPGRRPQVGFRVLLVSPPGGVGTDRGAKDKPAPPVVPPFIDADVQRICALPAAEQVEEVRKELMRRNPGFNGRVQRKIEDGVVSELRILTDKVTDVAPIRVFSALRVLDCSGTQTNWRGNSQLADLTPLDGMSTENLTHLNLAYTKVGDEGMAHFKNCRNLESLMLDDTKVGDAGLANFKDCKNLKTLLLGETQVGDNGLTHFQDCEGLAALNLATTKVTDAGMVCFTGRKGLKYINLTATEVSDEGLKQFQDCTDLRVLFLGRTSVSDSGLAVFKDCKKLERLVISNTRITDFSLLKGMPLKALECDLQPERKMEILRSIKTLEQINGRPAAEFWNEVEQK